MEIAERHNLEIISIEELIAHRRLSEKLVTRVTEAALPTRYGKFKIVIYGVKYEEDVPVALVLGDVARRRHRRERSRWCACTPVVSRAT